MRIVVASDSFKGSLSSQRIIELVRVAALELGPHAEVVGVPMADGGEGTVEAVAAAVGGELRHATVSGPLGEPVRAGWGLLPGGAAVIEMAAASGLPLVRGRPDVMSASTFGTGELIAAALDAGSRSVTLAIGGSATNDGGMGCLRALGARFLDARGGELLGRGADLGKVAMADLSGLDARLGDVTLSVMCDVDGPLLGPDGATRTFAPQKGADAAMVEELERGMGSYAGLLERATRTSAASLAGSGAAGGLGFGLRACLGATMTSGIERVLDLVGFDALLDGADLCVTGEGRLDSQTAHGKVVCGVARRCACAGVPCVALVGSVTPDVDARSLHLADVHATAPADLPLGDAMERAEELYATAARHVLELWR